MTVQTIGPPTHTHDVVTPVGVARLHLTPAAGRKRATLVVGHGAGGGVSAPDLVALSTYLPVFGYSVVRVEQPWRVAGGRVAPAPARLDRAWVPCVDAARDLIDSDVPLVVGGRSAGARVACRTAATVDAAGVVALAFPLHPPGRPERSRLDELQGAAAKRPVLVVQGDRDPFGVPREFPDISVATVPGADHAMRVRKRGEALVTQGESAVLLAELVRAWWEGLTTRGNRLASQGC